MEANGSIAGGDSYSTAAIPPGPLAKWTKVTYEFTLTEQTKVNLIMMNPKTTSYATASEKLVDDASLTTTDGGIVGYAPWHLHKGAVSIIFFENYYRCRTLNFLPTHIRQGKENCVTTVVFSVP